MIIYYLIPKIQSDIMQKYNCKFADISIGSTDTSVSPSHLTISVPQLPTTPTNGRSSMGSIGSDFTNTDVQEIVGGGRKKKTLDKNSYVCGNCCIQ